VFNRTLWIWTALLLMVAINGDAKDKPGMMTHLLSGQVQIQPSCPGGFRSVELKMENGSYRVIPGGVAVTEVTITTKAGQKIIFYTLYDKSGLVGCPSATRRDSTISASVFEPLLDPLIEALDDKSKEVREAVLETLEMLKPSIGVNFGNDKKQWMVWRDEYKRTGGK
jgi:hypothetical protein